MAHPAKQVDKISEEIKKKIDKLNIAGYDVNSSSADDCTPLKELKNINACLDIIEKGKKGKYKKI